MIQAKIKATTVNELELAEQALKTLGLERHGNVKSDGFSYFTRFASADTAKTGKTEERRSK